MENLSQRLENRRFIDLVFYSAPELTGLWVFFFFNQKIDIFSTQAPLMARQK